MQDVDRMQICEVLLTLGTNLGGLPEGRVTRLYFISSTQSCDGTSFFSRSLLWKPSLMTVLPMLSRSTATGCSRIAGTVAAPAEAVLVVVSFSFRANASAAS